MSGNATAEAPPAKRARRAAANTSIPDKGELAARLFVKLYDNGSGRTPAHYAERAIEAAEAFLETYDNHR